jgi:DNA-binding MarR family transcriptional regulator
MLGYNGFGVMTQSHPTSSNARATKQDCGFPTGLQQGAGGVCHAASAFAHATRDCKDSLSFDALDQGRRSASDMRQPATDHVSAVGYDAVTILREVIVSLVRRDDAVLSSHQLGVYLTCYVVDGDHTVRGLAADLNVSKSVITRALDKLGEMNLARRRIDPRDRRSVIVERTAEGTAMLDHLRRLSVEAQRILDCGPQG